ncbi:PREDICTED: galacturonokinase isoform X2 [Nelumbo nucifera]|uniref:Galacturonokinase isoform X2 n=2 Tax=Nelumbo nucifera TaxID=4432 RepID=A0A1U8ACV9_NELNU|nr:PREDICTED: galacturonokinase isoform X2 [Nelumbo nucifera]
MKMQARFENVYNQDSFLSLLGCAHSVERNCWIGDSRSNLKMGASSWPSETELDGVKKMVAEMSGRGVEEVRVVVSPYRICPLGAHIDHQGGTVSAMTINKGILLGFIPSGNTQVLLRSGQFEGIVRFRVDEVQHPRSAASENNKVHENDSSKTYEECDWGTYARGALYALQKENHLTQVGVAYLLALENANSLTVPPTENIELDRVIENEYLGLRNGILDQSAILLSSYGCLTCMNCKTKEHKLIHSPKLHGSPESKGQKAYKILLAFSGLKHALPNNPGYNRRVAECQEAARILLDASGNGDLEPLLCYVEPAAFEAHKCTLESNLLRRAEHYFSENMRVAKGLEAWASGNLDDFGKLISASGLSSIQNYECGCEPLIQLYEILLRTPGILGARFSGAGFRGCCLAFVEADRAIEAASFVRNEYHKLQPVLASQLNQDTAVLICEAGDCAHVI